MYTSLSSGADRVSGVAWVAGAAAAVVVVAAVDAVDAVDATTTAGVCRLTAPSGDVSAEASSQRVRPSLSSLLMRSSLISCKYSFMDQHQLVDDP